ncbi:MAG: PHP domain-containing protein [Spirochaetales bacterium]|nr:PHP domain-containing protein [Spirochaetales bacterium]
MIDLHTHSTASDGRLDPTSLVELAHKTGLTLLALTDHDTTAGLDEAAQACQRHAISFIPGIEWEINNPNGEFHLLGLGLKNWSGGFALAVDKIQKLRHDRNQKIFARMLSAGLKGDYSEVEELAQGGQIGRPHFARFLVARGKVSSVQDAFNQFLGRGKLFWEPKVGLDFDEAIELIHSAGGQAVIAHPLSLALPWASLEEQLLLFKSRGLDGLEAWHPSASVGACRRLEEMAQRLNLIVTAGSDFHGGNRPDRRLGFTAGKRPIDCKFADFLLNRPLAAC